MVNSIEEDFIENFKEKLIITDIPTSVVEKSKKVEEEKDVFLSILRGLDIQSYIEICNANILKLNINVYQKNFINTNLNEIITIRNRVMHPRPLGFFDYSKLKTVFENISTELSCFTWVNVEKTKHQIETDPESLIPPPESLKKSDRIIENLPSVLEYEETSFIGRKKEIGEIKAQLNRRNVNILSIIGDGGVGKTTTVLKLLYDMLDDPDCKFELIIWTSLKTNELSGNDFSEIVNSIKTTSEMYEELAPFVACDSIEDTQKFIIELAQNFNTLFVLDNLETINTSDIKDFIDEFSEYGKVLITSRIGLGEMEHRYKLNGLNESDVLEYTDRLLSLYGFECYFTDDNKKNLVVNELHSNPLAIKWFIRCLYNGQSENEILNHKEDVINFCMANVYDKLSTEARIILNILTVADVQLSFPEIMYYLDGEISDCLKVKYAINELGKCNFINEEKFKREKNVSVTEFAREFLKLNFSDVKQLHSKFKILRTKLSSFGQQLLIKRLEDNLDIGSIHYKDMGELVAALYLRKALSASNQDDAISYIEYAQELMPMYFENNLISARIYGTTSPLKAEEEYKIAIKHCSVDSEKIRVLFLYSNFLVRISNYLEAIEVLQEAQKLNINTIDVIIQNAKIHCYVGKYETAKELLRSIELNGDSLTTQQINNIQTVKADIFKRQCETIDIRETQKRLNILKQAYNCLFECKSPDRKVFDYMVKILHELSFLYTDNDVLMFILEIINNHYNDLKKLPSYKDFKNSIKENFDNIHNDVFKAQISKFIINYNEYLHLLNSNEAVVYSIKSGYGFCKNNSYTQGIYFSMNGLPQDIEYGDVLSYSAVLESKGRFSVVNPKRVGKIEERIEK